MKFSEAMEILEEWGKVRASTWEPGKYLVIGKSDFKPNYVICNEMGIPLHYLGDFLEEEWKVYIKDKYNFIGVMEMLQKGEKLRRTSWNNQEFYIKMDEYGDVVDRHEDTYAVNMNDFTAKDWVVV